MTSRLEFIFPLAVLAPFFVLTALAVFALRRPPDLPLPLRAMRYVAGFNLACAALVVMLQWVVPQAAPMLAESGAGAWTKVTTLSSWFALLVHALALVIGGFSLRYLRGEPLTGRLLACYFAVVASVHLLLIANHWLVLIVAWSMVGRALEPLLCFFPDRPFAQLAALKKRLADRLADLLLISAAAISWAMVGSGSFSDLVLHLDQGPASLALQTSAVCIVLAVILRTAALPVHGWLIQVMEAPTPVSALLHAGVVNLGGVVLIRLAPLLEAVPAARWILVAFGLGTAILAGMVMLTRISIKVRLAWSTVAQMGFMLLECGLGLYTMAAIHIVGHSIYKAHAFLAASSIVRETRLRQMHSRGTVSASSLVVAPALAWTVLMGVGLLSGGLGWPAWWSVLMAFAWAPLLWGPEVRETGVPLLISRVWAALLAWAGLTLAAVLAHAIPLGLEDAPRQVAGVLAAVAFGIFYVLLAWIRVNPASLAGWRRRAYAGFYLDEFFTRLALRVGTLHWLAPRASVADEMDAEPGGASRRSEHPSGRR